MAEFLVVVDTDSGSSRDYGDTNAAEGALQCNLTHATETKVFSISTKVGTLADNDAVTGQTSGATGTLVHYTASQALIKSIGATPFQNGEVVQKTGDGTKTFTLTDAGGRPQVSIECRATTGISDTSNPSVSGWTTSSTYYLKFWTAAGHRHAGKWTTGKYTLARTTSASNQIIFQNTEAGVEVQGIQFDLIMGSTAHDECLCIYDNPGYDGYGITVEQCLFRLSGSIGDYADCTAIVFYYTRAGEVSNNVIYGFKGVLLKGGGIWQYAGSYSCYIYCNTFADCGEMVGTDNTARLVLKNNVFADPRDGILDGASTSGGNCWDGSAQYAAFGTTQKTGTTTGSATNKLIDSGGGLGSIYVNSACKDSGSSYAKATAVDSATQLSIDANIYSSSEAYSIYTNQVGEPTFVNKAGKDFSLSTGDTVAQDKGLNLYSDSYYPITVDILGNPRPASGAFDIGAFELVASSGGYSDAQERGQVIGQMTGQNK